MAKESSSFVGGLLGVVVGVVLIGGIAGTPFYLDMFMPDGRAIDLESEGDVETIRRVVLNLDQHLASIEDVEGLLGDDLIVTPDVAAELAAADEGVFSDAMMKSLDTTASMLRRAQAHDKDLGIENPISIQSGKPNARDSVQRMKNEYLAANQKLKRVAEASIQTLRPLRRGEATATSRLQVARGQAVFYFTVGKMLANKAEFFHDQAAYQRRQANAEFRKFAAVQRDLDMLKAQSPTKALADLQERMHVIEEAESALNSNVSQITSAIDSIAERLGSLDARATAAREQMAELEAGGALSNGGSSTEYLTISSEARRAEAESEKLRNCPSSSDGGPQLGLRDLRLKLEQAETMLAAYREARAELEKREDVLNGQASSIADLQSSLTDQADELIQQAMQLVSLANERGNAADESAKFAQEEFKRAASLTSQALRAASGIRRSAQTASSGAGGKPDERLEAIKKDGDTEASLYCLAAEIAYFDALTRAQQIQTLSRQADLAHSAEAFSGKAAESDFDARIKQLREEANEKLVGAGAESAIKNYEKALQQLQGSSVRTDSGTISGSNYLWQVQVGEAAVHLLRSTIAAIVDGEPDRDAQNQAYNLLKEAAEGREQSPLLRSALDTILYLQDAVK